MAAPPLSAPIPPIRMRIDDDLQGVVSQSDAEKLMEMAQVAVSQFVASCRMNILGYVGRSTTIAIADFALGVNYVRNGDDEQVHTVVMSQPGPAGEPGRDRQFADNRIRQRRKPPKPPQPPPQPDKPKPKERWIKAVWHDLWCWGWYTEVEVRSAYDTWQYTILRYISYYTLGGPDGCWFVYDEAAGGSYPRAHVHFVDWHIDVYNGSVIIDSTFDATLNSAREYAATVTDVMSGNRVAFSREGRPGWLNYSQSEYSRLARVMEEWINGGYYTGLYVEPRKGPPVDYTTGPQPYDTTTPTGERWTFSVAPFSASTPTLRGTHTRIMPYPAGDGSEFGPDAEISYFYK